MAARVAVALLLIVFSLTPFPPVNAKRDKDQEAVIEEVSAKQVLALLDQTSFVAVFFYGRLCGEDCDYILQELENIDDDTDRFGVAFVKCQDRKFAKTHGVTKFPALVYFRNKEPAVYEGDLKDEDKVLSWLTDLDSMENPDAIEEINPLILTKILEDSEYVAVLFYRDHCKRCDKALKELENIDDDADKLGIAFVKIRDDELLEEYGFEDVPQLVYYRLQIPLVFEGDLMDEEEVLAWLVDNKNVNDEDIIEDVTAKTLMLLIDNEDHLAVLFYDNEEEDSMRILAELERIDDESEDSGVRFVKIDDENVDKDFGIENTPALVYFEKGIPSLYDGDLFDEEEVLEWLIDQLNSDEIEDVTDEMLDRIIKRSKHLAVVFYDRDDKKSQRVLEELENIDDECDQREIYFVKIDNEKEAHEYGIEELPALIYFENEIPSIYDGDLMNEDAILKWLIAQVESDEIEDISEKMLEQLIERAKRLAVLFYKKDDKNCQKAMLELENIDDDCDKNGIMFVKTDDDTALKEFGIDQVPALIYFEEEIPALYHGDLSNEDRLLDWLVNKGKSDDIEEINDEILRRLIKKVPHMAALFYDSDDKKSHNVIAELEGIDDDLDKHGISIVKIDDDKLVKEYGLDEIPMLIYYENGIPNIYEGDLTKEDEVLDWLIHQKNEDTIEEITEEILEDLVRDHEYVMVYFTGPDCDECEDVLLDLENIDDDTDGYGIHFVTTEDVELAKRYGIKTFPSLVFFRNGEPLLYKVSDLDELKDEEKVLKWMIHDDTLEIPDQIEEVNVKMLDKILDTSKHVVVFFYAENCKKCDKILSELEHIDDDADQHDIDFVKISDPGVADGYGLVTLPALVYFRNHLPQIYGGDLEDEESALHWIMDLKEKPDDVIEIVDRKMLEMLVEEVENLAVFFFKANCDNCDVVLHELENIDDETDSHGIQFVKTNDIKYAEEFGILEFPSLVYFEDKIPSLYEGDLTREEQVLDWLIKQKMEDTIENINRDMLSSMIEERDFLAVFFYKDKDADSEYVLKILELIDDDSSEYGVEIVKMNDLLMAKKYGIRNPPGIILFNHANPSIYKGDMEDEDDILEWITDPDNLKHSDHIELVNRKMFEKIRKRSDYLAALFYSEVNCKQCEKVLVELENIDDEANSQGIEFVKVNDAQFAKEYGVYSLPAVVFFKSRSDEPVIYAGDLKNEERILDWILSNQDPSGDFIEEIEGKQLHETIGRASHVAVFFYNQEDCDICDKVLEELENIDDDTDRLGILFVKTQDLKIAEKFGVHEFPVLLFFEHQVPNVYEGDLLAEEEVLQWLVTQKNEDTIEAVNRDMLEKLIEDTQYLSVFFYKPNCKACDQVLAELENIDDDLDVYGITMVKIHDSILAKRYGIKTVPAVVYFRNGNPLIYDGDMKNEELLLEWLTDDDNRELADEIEAVNNRMLDRLLDDSSFLAVFFYDEGECPECAAVLAELENIDDEADTYGVDFVKINDPEAAEKYNILTTPALVYFRKRMPMLYEGDLLDEERILAWLTSQDVFEIKGEIEEVNRKMLDKLLDENDFVAVYFYDYNCPKCEDVLDELEHIDDEADNLDITFVKIKDPRYAKKYGINQLPALVYFRRKFPSIYRGDLLAEDEVLEWLQKNRYRHPELNLFMYALAAITMAFILYTIFLMFCFKGHQKTA